MLKTISKFVLVAAVAATAVSFSTPSFAAKKKKAAPATCVAPKHMKGACTNGLCSMTFCGLDGKWYPSIMMCWEPFCPN